VPIVSLPSLFVPQLKRPGPYGLTHEIVI